MVENHFTIPVSHICYLVTVLQYINMLPSSSSHLHHLHPPHPISTLIPSASHKKKKKHPSISALPLSSPFPSHRTITPASYTDQNTFQSLCRCSHSRRCLWCGTCTEGETLPPLCVQRAPLLPQTLQLHSELLMQWAADQRWIVTRVQAGISSPL